MDSIHITLANKLGSVLGTSLPRKAPSRKHVFVQVGCGSGQCSSTHPWTSPIAPEERAARSKKWWLLFFRAGGLFLSACLCFCLFVFLVLFCIIFGRKEVVPPRRIEKPEFAGRRLFLPAPSEKGFTGRRPRGPRAPRKTAETTESTEDHGRPRSTAETMVILEQSWGNPTDRG